jgi:hypothetical protein
MRASQTSRALPPIGHWIAAEILLADRQVERARRVGLVELLGRRDLDPALERVAMNGSHPPLRRESVARACLSPGNGRPTDGFLPSALTSILIDSTLN